MGGTSGFELLNMCNYGRNKGLIQVQAPRWLKFVKNSENRWRRRHNQSGYGQMGHTNQFSSSNGGHLTSGTKFLSYVESTSLMDKMEGG
jgi:hypothetical protein